MWQAHPNKANVHSVDPRVFSKFEDKLKDIKTAVLNPFHEIITDTCFSHIQPPKTAYSQAFEALDQLKMEFGAWRDFIEVVRGLQHHLLKLLAFADWWHDVHQGEDFQPLFCTPTCGAIFEDKDLYDRHAHWSIASYLFISNDHFALDPNKQVDLSLRTSSQMDRMSIQPLIHSLHLWYYPPHVNDVYSHFKTVTCGYAKRLDSFNPMKGFKRTLDKLGNQKADEGTFIFWICAGHNSRHFLRWP